MKIGILGSRGIPNNYGGFEQFAEYISKGLKKLDYKVIVYNTHNHSYKKSEWEGVQIIHQYNPEKRIGMFGQLIYDFNCILSARKQKFDIIFQLGYTSSSVWYFLLPSDSIIVTNMDGLEWKRSKYSRFIRFLLQYAEKWAVFLSNFLIADSICIKSYLTAKYNKDVKFIPYGATAVYDFDKTILKQFSLEENKYFITIARIEPENNIDLILSSYLSSNSPDKMVIIGDVTINSHGKYIKAKYSKYSNIIFIGGIYDINILNILRHFAKIYFHGHTVGGTNPSLLEAMASQVFIAAHDNEFNRAIISDDGKYFSTEDDIIEIINKSDSFYKEEMIKNNLVKIEITYNWESIIEEYDLFFQEIIKYHK